MRSIHYDVVYVLDVEYMKRWYHIWITYRVYTLYTWCALCCV